MIERLAPMHEKRMELSAKPEMVKEILHEGAKRARKVAQATMAEVRAAMHLD